MDEIYLIILQVNSFPRRSEEPDLLYNNEGTNWMVQKAAVVTKQSCGKILILKAIRK